MVLTKQMTVEEFEQLPDDGKRYELVRGVLREMPMGGFRHSRIGVGISSALLVHALPRGLGEVSGADGAFRVFSDEETVLVPDVDFVRADRLPSLEEQDRIGRFAPDLVVEVVSPTDRMSDMLDKVAEYLRAGVRLVWVVEPKRRVVTVHRPGREPQALDERQELDGEEIVPSFRLAVVSIFR